MTLFLGSTCLLLINKTPHRQPHCRRKQQKAQLAQRTLSRCISLYLTPIQASLESKEISFIVLENHKLLWPKIRLATYEIRHRKFPVELLYFPKISKIDISQTSKTMRNTYPSHAKAVFQYQWMFSNQQSLIPSLLSLGFYVPRFLPLPCILRRQLQDDEEDFFKLIWTDRGLSWASCCWHNH